MGIDLLALEPTKISRDLRGKYLLIYGAPKTGKTTLLAQLPHSLILAFEPGTNALNNAYVQPIQKWTDFKTVINQLKSDAARERFHFIGIDTTDIAWDLCDKYICIQNEVSTIGDIPYGRGYDLCKKEFSEAFRTIAQLGYGICFVSHETDKKFKNEQGEEYMQLIPAMPTRPYDIVNKFVDIIAYIRYVRNPDTGENKPFLFLRGDDRFLAGSRFKYMVPKVEFSYENLVNAIQSAIDKEVELNGAVTTDEANMFYKQDRGRPFTEAMDEAKTLWQKLVVTNDDAARIISIIEKIFGKRLKLSEVTESQQDLLELVIAEMRNLA